MIQPPPTSFFHYQLDLNDQTDVSLSAQNESPKHLNRIQTQHDLGTQEDQASDQEVSKVSVSER